MKAVVMAGGEGRRLRPLTCTRPKPMIKIMGKPVIGYIIDLLLKNGFDEIAVTTRYRSEDIEDYIEDLSAENADIYCIEEENVLGTAGSVKNAAKNWNEPFLVISGDCICDLGLSKVMLYHKSIMADITIVCSTVEEPGEYGTVNLTRSGAVDSFCEKPDWSHCGSNLANTGIYIVNPAVLQMIPDDVSYDFANDLFPSLMNEGKRLFGYQTECYWCDIGDLKSYRMCARDMMSHKVRLELPDRKNGVFAENGTPEGNYDIIPPVYIGKNVSIGNNCVIGPFTVLEDNVSVGNNTRIKKSIVMSNSLAGGNCDVIGSIIGEKCLLKRNTVSLEGACIGDGSVIDCGSTVLNNVLVWPDKHVSYRSVLTDNLRDGKNQFELICSDSVSGTTFSEISCERCCRLAQAVASSACGAKVGIGYDGTNEAKTLAMAFLSGLISCGSEISDFGECFESQMGYFVSFCSLNCGVFISADEKNAKISFFGEYGLPLCRKYERDIENRFKRSDFNYISGKKCRSITDMSSVSEIYEGQLLAFAGEKVFGAAACVKSRNRMIRETAEKCFYLLGCRKKDTPEFVIEPSGKTVSAKDEDGNTVSYEKLVSLCAMNALSEGCDICLPFDAPSFLEKAAEKNNRSIFRAGPSPMIGFGSEAGVCARKNMWAFDGLSLVFRVMGIMAHKEKTLEVLVKSLPQFNIAEKTVVSSVAPAKLASLLGIQVSSDSQGLRKNVGKGCVTVMKTGAGRMIKIIAEADTMEAAEEICIDAEKKINSDIDK